MSRKGILVLIALALLALLAGTVWYAWPAQPQASALSMAATPTIYAVVLPTTAEPQVYYYPMTNYVARLTNRWYGKAVSAIDREPLNCGFPYTAIHTGDDLEVEPAELSANTPVHAIANGTVLRVGRVSGYGGLVVLKHTLAEQLVTAYYGHIDLSQTTLQVGDRVTAGQVVSYLGDDCSEETAEERKHLHFAIHKGAEPDLRGYVDNQTELESWLNPRQLLLQLSAKVPSAN